MWWRGLGPAPSPWHGTESLSLCPFSSRCLVAWWQVTLARSKQREACSEFEGTRQRHLLALCFVQWRTELLRAKQGEGACPQQSTVPARAFRRWRGATRGRQVLHLDSVARVKQVRMCQGVGVNWAVGEQGDTALCAEWGLPGPKVIQG